MSKMAPLSVRYRAIGALKPIETNPRTHSKRQIRQIARSIEEFGFVNPVLIDADDRIIAGHGRVEAARMVGITEVPTVRIEHLSPAQLRAYVIADNRLAERAGWDKDLLALELGTISDFDIDFDLSLTGFDLAEIDLLLDPAPGSASAGQMEEAPPVADGSPAVSRVGDLWELGRHRLICDDALDIATYRRLLGDERAQVAFCDPPYNVQIAGHARGKAATPFREFAMASGEMTSEAFTEFLATAFGHLAAFSVEGAIHYQCMDWRHLREALTAGERVYAELKNLCVWNKDRAGMGSFYRSKHELVLVFKVGRAAHINNVELGKHGRDRTNVWDYPAVRPTSLDRGVLGAEHPTIKPVALVADALQDSSHRNGIVLDAFGGSGTTLMAAHQTGRRARMIELDPLYVDATVRRWQAATGETARLVATGESFADREHEATGGAALGGPHKPRVRVPVGRGEVGHV